MDKAVVKALLRSLGWNTLAGIVGLLPLLFLNDDNVIGWLFFLLIIAVVSLITQFIIAIVYIANPKRKAAGQGMIMSLGLFLLIGAAVCGSMWI
jgi:hypothetical protein